MFVNETWKLWAVEFQVITKGCQVFVPYYDKQVPWHELQPQESEVQWCYETTRVNQNTRLGVSVRREFMGAD